MEGAGYLTLGQRREVDYILNSSNKDAVSTFMINTYPQNYTYTQYGQTGKGKGNSMDKQKKSRVSRALSLTKKYLVSAMILTLLLSFYSKHYNTDIYDNISDFLNKHANKDKFFELVEKVLNLRNIEQLRERLYYSHLFTKILSTVEEIKSIYKGSKLPDIVQFIRQMIAELVQQGEKAYGNIEPINEHYDKLKKYIFQFVEKIQNIDF